MGIIWNAVKVFTSTRSHYDKYAPPSSCNGFHCTVNRYSVGNIFAQNTGIMSKRCFYYAKFVRCGGSWMQDTHLYNSSVGKFSNLISWFLSRDKVSCSKAASPFTEYGEFQSQGFGHNPQLVESPPQMHVCYLLASTTAMGSPLWYNR